MSRVVVYCSALKLGRRVEKGKREWSTKILYARIKRVCKDAKTGRIQKFLYKKDRIERITPLSIKRRPVCACCVCELGVCVCMCVQRVRVSNEKRVRSSQENGRLLDPIVPTRSILRTTLDPTRREYNTSNDKVQLFIQSYNVHTAAPCRSRNEIIVLDNRVEALTVACFSNRRSLYPLNRSSRQEERRIATRSSRIIALDSDVWFPGSISR